MDKDEVLRWLERKGTRRNVEGKTRYGIRAARGFGVFMSTMQPLMKRLGKDHARTVRIRGMPGIDRNKVMHANFRIGETQVMASDGRCEGKPSFQGFALSLTVPNEIEAERRFAALAEGGQVQMPLAKTFFSPRFGMVADRLAFRGW